MFCQKSRDIFKYHTHIFTFANNFLSFHNSLQCVFMDVNSYKENVFTHNIIIIIDWQTSMYHLLILCILYVRFV